MNEKNGRMAHRTKVAGRGIVRNYGRNNNSPATGNDVYTKVKVCPLDRSGFEIGRKFCAAQEKPACEMFRTDVPKSRKRRIRTNGFHVLYCQDQRNPFRMACFYTKIRVFLHRKVRGSRPSRALRQGGTRSIHPCH